MIDLERYAEIWEDFYDSMIARQRANEPRIPLEIVKEALKQEGRLDA